MYPTSNAFTSLIAVSGSSHRVLLFSPHFYHIENMVCRTFTSEFQLNSNESSPHDIFNLVPSQEKTVVLAHSLCENMQTYKTFNSIISMKTHLKRHSRLITWCWLKKQKQREKEKQLWCTVVWKSMEGRQFELWSSAILDNVRFYQIVMQLFKHAAFVLFMFFFGVFGVWKMYKLKSLVHITLKQYVLMCSHRLPH